MTSNASKTSTASANQKSFESYKTLASEGKSLKVGKIFYKDGKQYQLHIFAKDTSGEWIKPGDRLNEKAPEIVQKVDELSKVLTSATDTSHDDKKVQDKFYKATDVLHVKNDKLEDSQSELSKIPIPKSAQKEFERLAFGGITDGISAHQKEILEFKTSGKDLSTISDKTFVKAYKESKKELTKTGHTPTHEEIYATAMTKYVTQSVSDFLSGVPAGTRDTLTAKLNQEAQKAHGGSEPPSDTWIKSQDLKDPTIHTAIFKALNEVGPENYTAQHVFDQMKSKVCDAWDKVVEPKIDPSSVVATLIPTGEGVSPEVLLALKESSKEASPKLVPKSEAASDSCKAILTTEKSFLESELTAVKKSLDTIHEINSRMPTWYPFNSAWQKVNNELEAVLKPLSGDHEQEIIIRLMDRQEELEGLIEGLDSLDLTSRHESLKIIGQEIGEIDKAIRGIDQDSWTKGDLLRAVPKMIPLFGRAFEWGNTQATEKLQAKRTELTHKADQIKKSIQKEIDSHNWDSSTQSTKEVATSKSKAIYTGLQAFSIREDKGDIEADFASAHAKLMLAKRDKSNAFTDEEMKAISLWQPGSPPTTHEEYVNELASFLLTKSLESSPLAQPSPASTSTIDALMKALAPKLSTFNTSKPPTEESVRKALTLLSTQRPSHKELLKDDMLLAIAYNLRSPRDVSGESDSTKKYNDIILNMQDSLAYLRLNEIMVSGITEDAAYTKWTKNQSSEHYKEALSWVVGAVPFDSLSKEAKCALLFTSKQVNFKNFDHNELHELTDQLRSRFTILVSSNQTKGINNSTYNSWKTNPSVKDLEGALAFLTTPTEDSIPTGVKIDHDNETFDAAKDLVDMRDKLSSHIRVMSLPETLSRVEAAGYKPTSMDLSQARLWLINPETTLTVGAKKALKTLGDVDVLDKTPAERTVTYLAKIDMESQKLTLGDLLGKWKIAKKLNKDYSAHEQSFRKLISTSENKGKFYKGILTKLYEGSNPKFTEAECVALNKHVEYLNTQYRSVSPGTLAENMRARALHGIIEYYSLF